MDIKFQFLKFIDPSFQKIIEKLAILSSGIY